MEVAAAAAAAAVVDAVVVGDNPSEVCSSSCASAEGVAVVGVGSGTGPMAESLSRERAGQDGRLTTILSLALASASDWAWALAWVSNYLITSRSRLTTCSSWNYSSHSSCVSFRHRRSLSLLLSSPP